MAKFYFHLHNDLEVPDKEGQDLADLMEAQVVALQEAREMAAAAVRSKGEIDLGHRIDIVSESGQTVSTVFFRDAVQIVD